MARKIVRRRPAVVSSRLKAFSSFLDDFSSFKSSWKTIRGLWSTSGSYGSTLSQPDAYPISAVKMSKSDVTISVQTPASGVGAAIWVTDSGNWWGVTHNRTSESCNCQSCPVNYCSSYNCSYNYCSSYNCSVCTSPNYSACCSATSNGNCCTATSIGNCCAATSNGNCCTATSNGNCCLATGWQAGYFYCGSPYSLQWACLYYNNNNNSGTYGCVSRYYWYNCTTYWTSGFYYNYCSSYSCSYNYCSSYNCVENYCSSYNCSYNYCSSYTCYSCDAASNGNCCGATSYGNCCGATYYTSCNCQTCYPVVIQVIQSISNVVSQVTSWAIGSIAAAIKVITSGNTITTKAYSDTGMTSQIGSDLVHTATGAVVNTQFGILVSPTVYNQGTSVGTVNIQTN